MCRFSVFPHCVKSFSVRRPLTVPDWLLDAAVDATLVAGAASFDLGAGGAMHYVRNALIHIHENLTKRFGRLTDVQRQELLGEGPTANTNMERRSWRSLADFFFEHSCGVGSTRVLSSRMRLSSFEATPASFYGSSLLVMWEVYCPQYSDHGCKEPSQN